MSRFLPFVFIVVVLNCVLCDTVPSFTDGIVTSLKHCLNQKDKMDCLKRKVIMKLDDEIKSNGSIEITNGLFLKRDPDFSMENSVNGKRDLNLDISEARGFALNDLILAKVSQFFKSRTLEFSLGESADEGRKRKGGKGGSIFMYGAMGLATVLGQVFLGKLALVSGAALMIAKISLLLALLTALKKLSGGGGGGSEHVVYASNKEEHGGWQRSGMSHDLAYRGYLNRQKKSDDFVPNNYYYYQDKTDDSS